MYTTSVSRACYDAVVSKSGAGDNLVNYLNFPVARSSLALLTRYFKPVRWLEWLHCRPLS